MLKTFIATAIAISISVPALADETINGLSINGLGYNGLGFNGAAWNGFKLNGQDLNGATRSFAIEQIQLPQSK